MRPGARVQAAIELVAAVERSLAEGGAPADRLIQDYFRARRYAGSKDRRWVIDAVYAVLRQRGMLLWRLGGDGKATPRLLVLLSLGPEADAEWFDGAHVPEPLTDEEKGALEAAADPADAPAWARFNLPEWVLPDFEARFGDRLETELAAMAERAPLDLRVNVLRGTVEQAREALPDAEPCPWSPAGLRLAEGVPLQQLPAYRDGLVEVQDEGSQIAALLCGAGPGLQVADLCAGGGGKALALAAEMGHSGQLYAYDTDRRRLDDIRPRAKRADARNINYLSSLSDLSKAMDRVVLDVPCSGSGTWRRSPELRWRLTPERLEALLKTQADLLQTGSAFVKPGGRLIYITCSLLEAEGEAQIDAFLLAHPDFAPLPYADLWPGEGAPPATLSRRPDCLLLTPATHGTDGFFVAVLERHN